MNSVRAGRIIIQIIVILMLLIVPRIVSAADESISYRVADYLKNKDFSNEFIVALISALPIVELRGAIPVAHHMMNMNPLTAYLIAVAGNMIPVIPLLLFLGPASSFCMRFRYGRKFFEWFFERARRKSKNLEKYETLGLSIFVAIPLPVTGAWTGCAAAFLMGTKFRHAFWAILLGVAVSGAIVTALSILGLWGAAIASAVLLGLLLVSILKMFKSET